MCLFYCPRNSSAAAYMREIGGGALAGAGLRRKISAAYCISDNIVCETGLIAMRILTILPKQAPPFDVFLCFLALRYDFLYLS